MEWKIDKTLNVEGIIAALAIFGAAVGFVLNLIKGWRNDYKETRYRGTNSIILDLLEQNFENGLSEEELWNLYSSTDTLSKREAFKAFGPEKLKRIGFEGQLKHLQSRFLIRLTGPAHYHIDFSEPRQWKRFYQVDMYKKIVAQIQNEIGQEELNKILSSVIVTSDMSFYKSSEVHTYLIEKGDKDAIQRVIADLKNPDLTIRKKATELFVELNDRCRY